MLEEHSTYHEQSYWICFPNVCKDQELVYQEFILYLPDDVPISEFNFDIESDHSIYTI